MEQEIWKDIKGYEGYYKISSLGRIKSLERVDRNNHIIKEKIRALRIAPNGYYRCNLAKDGATQTKSVHVLVAIAFHGHVPDGHNLLVDHDDNIKLNNRADNIKIVTSRVNVTKDRKGGSSKYVGVSFHKATNKWQASIRVNDNNKYLGVFEDEIDAHLKYQEELKKLLSEAKIKEFL